MESQVGWGAALLLMALAAAHAAEEIVAESRFSRTPGVGAATRLKAWLGERIGPLLLLAALALAGVLVDHFWIWLALGIVVADLARHAASSISIRAYTPASRPAPSSPSTSWPSSAARCRSRRGPSPRRGVPWWSASPSSRSAISACAGDGR